MKKESDGMKLFWSLCVPCRIKVQQLKRREQPIMSEELCNGCREKCERYAKEAKI